MRTGLNEYKNTFCVVSSACQEFLGVLGVNTFISDPMKTLVPQFPYQKKVNLFGFGLF